MKPIMFLLSKGSMTQQFASGFAAALLLSGIAAPTVHAQSVGQAADAVASNPTAATDTIELQPAADLAPELSDDVLVYPHTIDGRQAATLFVKDIPVLTFIGTEVDSLSNSNSAIALATTEASTGLQAGVAPAGDILSAAQENDPVLRASNLGAQLSPGTLDAEALSVRWHEETDGFIVTLADEDLIALDSRTILADTTEDPAEDALQVTNRLRRLLGDAAPVEEIEGLPEPEPAPEVAVAPTSAIVYSNVGGASWYGPGFNGRLTANGETYNQWGITAAHRTLPFGTQVLVTNLNNGRQVTVRINDRGPYAGHRIIDLSAGAAAEIGLIDSGVATVQIDVLAY
ncbi:MAG: septal ring lytic transglycosylase RlpA family protein [Cyanobacteria bacterium J06573_11]